MDSSIQENDPLAWTTNSGNPETDPESKMDAKSEGTPRGVTSAVDPTEVEFRPISRDLAKIRLIGVGLPSLIILIAFTVYAVLVDPLFYLGTGVSLILLLWALWLIPRQVRAMKYAVTETDFMIRRGILFRSLTVVPFGRIQYADISEGPIARYFGISTIKLHTASAGTDASLEGVPKTEAARLRDLFSTNGSAHMQGI